MIDFKLWKEALMNPIETFKKEEKNADLTKGVIHFVIAGLISGFISGLAALAGMSAAGMTGAVPGMTGAGMGIMAFVTSLIGTPIAFVIGWLVMSAVIYIFAMIFQAKGDFVKQSYLLALYGAPLAIVTAVLGVIPFIGGALAFLASLYGLYLLTMVVKQVYKVSTGKAVVIWLLPVIVIAVLVSVLALGFFMAMAPFIATGPLTAG